RPRSIVEFPPWSGLRSSAEHLVLLRKRSGRRALEKERKGARFLFREQDSSRHRGTPSAGSTCPDVATGHAAQSKARIGARERHEGLRAHEQGFREFQGRLLRLLRQL